MPSPAESQEGERLKAYYTALTQRKGAVRTELLRFAPFPAVIPGFSWVSALFEPERHPEQVRQLLEHQDRMRALLFRPIELARVRRVLDVGFGSGADLVELAERWPHLELTGFNISEDQLASARRLAESRGVAERIELHHRDSARDPFPGQFDLALSFQVAHHVRDKAALFSNLAAHLVPSGQVVMAEIASRLDSPIDDPGSSAFFVPRATWADGLADAGLEVAEVVDASIEIANFLDDPSFESSLSRVAAGQDEATLAHLRGPEALGRLLRRELVSYLLIRARREPFLAREALAALNRLRLGAPTPFASAAASTARAWSAGATAALPAPAPVRSLRSRIAQASPSERGRMVTELLALQTAQVLELGAQPVDLEAPLSALGLDSMMALELRGRVEKALELTLSAPSVLGSSLEQLSRQLAELIERESSGQKTDPLAAIRSKVGELSASQVDQMLENLSGR